MDGYTANILNRIIQIGVLCVKDPMEFVRNVSRLIGGLAALVLAACSPVAMLNATVSKEGYDLHRDIPYGPETRHRLDIYVPQGLQGPAPVLLFFYGGNWQSGSKETYLALGQQFASRGIVTVIADYRLYPEVRYPDFLKDCAASFAFVQREIARFSGDPARIFLAGHSAGAYNAVMLGADPRYLKEAGASLEAVRGVIGIAGPYDFLPLTDDSLVTMFGGRNRTDTQPITYIDGKRPPMLLVTGDEDSTVRPHNTHNMAARLREKGSNVEERSYEGIGHLGIILSLSPVFPTKTPLREDMLRFIDAH
jgi:acetyl esterase/lipase